MNLLTLKSTLRNLRKNRTYTAINILGLTFGMLCVFFIYLWIQDEYSYDKFHENLDSLFRVEEEQFYSGQTYHVNVTPCPLAETFEEVFPEIIAASNFSGMGNRKFTYKDIIHYDNDIESVSSKFLQMFSFPLVAGDTETALDGKYSIVMSREKAKILFGKEDPIGKTVLMDDEHSMTVTGVFDKIPDRSSLNFDFLVTIEFRKDHGHWSTHWGNNNIQAYVQLAPNTSIEEFTQKINVFYKEKNEGTDTDLVLAPVKRMHLFSYFGYKEGLLIGHYVYIFSVIAIFILVIASINFVNLSTSLSLSKAKAIGIIKTNGARRIHIIVQFLSESLLLTMSSLAISIFLVYLLLNSFNGFTNKEIAFSVLFSPQSIFYLLLLILFTGIVAGIYPALLISSFKPITALKGLKKARHGKLTINKGLVVFQMVVSILLIVGTSITYKQTKYLGDLSLGFNQEEIITLDMHGDARSQFQTLKQKLTEFSGVVSVSGANHMPLNIMGNTSGVNWEGRGENSSILINYKGINYDYLTTMDIDLIEGRDCSEKFPSDASSGIIINETMKKLMGVNNAVGEYLDGWEGSRTIIGVTKDFHFSSPTNAVEPLIMLVQPNSSGHMFVKANPEMISEVRDHIQKSWNELIPDIPVNMNHIDQEYAGLYSNEEQTASLVLYFTIIAIIIACLGLFGLTSFTLQNKIKEIGIRKVNGARIIEVLALINSDIVKWVAIACVISTPIAWLSMTKWLENFAYRTPLNWWVFVVAGLIATAIATITVSWQSWRAASKNPVEALRYE